MDQDKVTYVNIPLTPELIDKLGLSLQSGRYNDKEILNLEFESPKPKNVGIYFDELEAERNANKLLSNVKSDIKNLISENKLEKALADLKNKLVLHSQSFDSIILLLAKLRRINEYRHQNIITFQQIEIEMSKIENAIMFMINNLNGEEINLR